MKDLRQSLEANTGKKIKIEYSLTVDGDNVLVVDHGNPVGHG